MNIKGMPGGRWEVGDGGWGKVEDDIVGYDNYDLEPIQFQLIGLLATRMK